MKRPSVIIIVFCLLISGWVYSQADPSSEITDAIRKGNTAELGKYFNEMVDLNIPGFKELYSKTQAERIVRDFFSNKPVSNVLVNREGSSADGSKYTMGTISAGGKKYSLYFLIRKNKGEYRIFILQIQAE